MSTGLSPQVVTETLWALSIRDAPNWTPEEIILITTGEGARRARQTLLDDKFGKIAALGRDYRRPDITALAERVRVEIIAGEAGPDHQDVDSDPAHRAAADLTMTVIRDLARDPARRIHASIAGGRKSQGALLALSMTLFARAGDRLSHVIVDDAFASHPDFFYPPPRPAVLVGRNGERVETAAARVRLADIPFPRLRARLPEEIFQAPGFAEAILDAQRVLDPLSLSLDPATGEVAVNGLALRLTPSLFAWLAALAWDCRSGGAGLPRNRLNGALIGRWRGGGTPVHRVIESEQVEEWTSRLNKLVRTSQARFSGVRLVASVGRRPDTCYRLNVAAEDIEWRGT